MFMQARGWTGGFVPLPVKHVLKYIYLEPALTIQNGYLLLLSPALLLRYTLKPSIILRGKAIPDG